MYDSSVVQEVLLNDRNLHNFIGCQLPFSDVDDPVGETVRYTIGDDDWLDLLVLHIQGYGWEVHIIDRSSDEIDLEDVRDDLLQKTSPFTAMLKRPHVPQSSPDPRISRLEELVEQLERLLPLDLQPVLDRLDKLTAYVLQPSEKQSYTVEEVADRTGLAPWTIRQACNKQLISAEKVNEKWRITHSELVRVQNNGIGRV
jgi:hypothetical protein